MNKPTDDKPLILVVSHVIPYPPAAGNEIRILKMLKAIQESGFGIILLFNQDHISEDIKNKLNHLFEHIHLISDDFGNEPLRQIKPSITGELFSFDFLRKINLSRFFSTQKNDKTDKAAEVKQWFASDRLIHATQSLYAKYLPVAVMVEYIFTSPCLKVIPVGVLKIIDTHDMFSRKKEQVLRYGIDDLLSISRREEREYLLNADLVIAIQFHEAQMFQKLVPELDVITVGIDFEVMPKTDDRKVVPGRILIVGSDNPLNIHGLKEFYSNAWPEIKSKQSGVTLCVVGKLANSLQTDDKQVFLNGWVDDLGEEYEKAAVIVNPTVAGTGLKIKSVEALCHGKALVSSPNGVEGIKSDDQESPFIVASDWPAFADSIVSVLQSHEKRMHLQELALKFATQNFGKNKVYKQLREKLKLTAVNKH